MEKLQFIPSKQLNDYKRLLSDDVGFCFDNLQNRELTPSAFKNYLTASAVASSQIEGSTLDINAFYRAKQNKIVNKEVSEIEDLIAAYQYAKRYNLNIDNFCKSHQILSSNFKHITQAQKGFYRKQAVGIKGVWGLIYLAADAKMVSTEMNKLFTDIEILINRKLNYKEAMFYASYIHFLFVKIHPFADGNGRAGRLIEKWFLSKKIGNIAWSIPSENYYFDNRNTYYGNLNTGKNYAESIQNLLSNTPFLLMLPKAVCYNPVF